MDRTIPSSVAQLLHQWFTVELEPTLRRPWLNFNRVRNMICYINRFTSTLNEWTDIKPNVLREYVAIRRFDTPRGVPLRPATIKREMQDMSNFLRFCEQEFSTGPIRSDICNLAPAAQWTNPKALDDIEADWLVARAAEVDRNARLYFTRGVSRRKAVSRDWPPMAFLCVVQLGIELGLRPGEALFAHRDEISLGARPVWSPKDLPARRLKNDLASTPLCIPPRLADTLREFVRLHDPKGYLFALPDSTEPGGHRQPYYDQIWRALAQEAALPGLNFHWLRHTFCTRVANRDDLTMQQVLELTRHLSPTTLQRYYKRRDPIDPVTGKRCVAWVGV